MKRQKKYLFVTLEAGGNLAPVLEAVRAVIASGHAARVLTEPCLQAAVESVGATFVPFERSFTRQDRSEDIFLDWQASSPIGALKSSLANVVFGPAEATAADVEAELGREPADALVVDWLLPAAILIGEARAIPTAALIHCVSMLPARGRPPGPLAPAAGPLGRLRDSILWWLFQRLVGGFGPAFDEVRARRGLAPLANPLDQYARATRVLMQVCEAFDFPAESEAAPAVYVGPALDDPDWLTRQSWESPFAPGDVRPLVVVSLSTTFQNQEGLLRLAIDALDGVDARVLVTAGPAMAGKAFACADNVVVVDQAPHSLVFEEASAFVSHCGHGSLMRALAKGVPVVALPMGRDQDANATRIVHHGLGLKPRKTRSGIRRAVERVLREPSFRRAAAVMGEHIRADAARGRLRDELLALASASPIAAPPERGTTLTTQPGT